MDRFDELHRYGILWSDERWAPRDGCEHGGYLPQVLGGTERQSYPEAGSDERHGVDTQSEERDRSLLYREILLTSHRRQYAGLVCAEDRGCLKPCCDHHSV